MTAMKSEAAVGADQRSAPHSSPGVLMASDNTGGDGQAPARCSAGLLKSFIRGEIKSLSFYKSSPLKCPQNELMQQSTLYILLFIDDIYLL